MGVVSLGGHAEIRQTGIGTINIRAQIGDRISTITLHNILHVPNADADYFSITVLLEKGGKIIFKDKGFTISVGNRDLAVGYMEHRLFWFDASIDSSSALHAHIVAPTDI